MTTSPCARVALSAPRVLQRANSDRPGGRDRATASRWSRIAGATGRPRACRGRPCRDCRTRGRGRARPCCGRRPCGRRRICRGGPRARAPCRRARGGPCRSRGSRAGAGVAPSAGGNSGLSRERLRAASGNRGGGCAGRDAAPVWRPRRPSAAPLGGSAARLPACSDGDDDGRGHGAGGVLRAAAGAPDFDQFRLGRRLRRGRCFGAASAARLGRGFRAAAVSAGVSASAAPLGAASSAAAFPPRRFRRRRFTAASASRRLPRQALPQPALRRRFSRRRRR